MNVFRNGGRWAVALFAALCGVSLAVADLAVEWGEPIEIGRGAYARIRRLKDGRYMAAYDEGGNLTVKFSNSGNIREWSAGKVVARRFTATNGSDKAGVSLTNAEFAQLADGRIILACNLRPDGWRHDVHPCAIGIMTSDDAGQTWSPLKVVHAPKPAMPADGKPHGCYEPFVLPGEGLKAQMFFADETPYEKESKCAWQEISYVETSDGGATWSKPKTAAYTPRRRDGMPVVLDFGKWRYLAIEANPGKTWLHPQLVRCSSVRGDKRDAKRFEPLAGHVDWTKTGGGAPYIAATRNYVLLSWQQSDRPLDMNTFSARVAAVPKKKIKADGTFRFDGVGFRPPCKVEPMLWNSLCPLEGDAFLLVSQVKGKIIIFPGSVFNR